MSTCNNVYEHIVYDCTYILPAFSILCRAVILFNNNKLIVSMSVMTPGVICQSLLDYYLLTYLFAYLLPYLLLVARLRERTYSVWGHMSKYVTDFTNPFYKKDSEMKKCLITRELVLRKMKFIPQTPTRIYL